ncbi:hypothetical protein, partial [Sutterella wadsworthensis]|uniref:hypothetical protein n=1 Tax=Sutterella wadsworthensis TaxID=40545 RepID=UPI00265B3E0F
FNILQRIQLHCRNQLLPPPQQILSLIAADGDNVMRCIQSLFRVTQNVKSTVRCEHLRACPSDAGRRLIKK